MDLTWGKGMASADRWVGVVDGAWVATETRQLTHLVLRRGWGFGRRMVAPSKQLDRCDQGGCHLRLSTQEVLSLPRARDAYRDASSVVLSGNTAVVLGDGTRLRLEGLRVTADSMSVTHLIVKRQWPATLTRLLTLDILDEMSPWRLSAGIRLSDLPDLPTYRPDPDIERDVWDALAESERLSLTDLQGIGVTVTDGTVILKGNVRDPITVTDVSRLIREVIGVAEVDVRLVSDQTINLVAASSIAALDPKLPDTVEIRTHLGSVGLRGYVTTSQLHEAILSTVREVNGVRAVEDSIEVRVPEGALA